MSKPQPPSSWTHIDNPRQMRSFLKEYCNFHDAITLKATWIGAEFIDTSGDLLLRGWGSLRLLIASQLTDVDPLELHFEHVKSFRYNYETEASGFQIVDDGITAQVLSWSIHAKAIRYRSAEKQVRDDMNRRNTLEAL